MNTNKFKRTLVTCALPYANGPVHIGHLAGVYIPADIFVRYLRMQGEQVLYICGSDEHGVPITIKAKKMGVSPQEVVDEYHAIIKKAFGGLGINFDIYSRTTSPVHHKTASEFFRKMYDENKFITKSSEQFFDESSQTFLADRYITGTCPKCGNERAYGDQCEKCGSTLSPDELVNPKSALSGNTPVKKETTHWYLPLDEYENWLRKWILEDHTEWKTNVYGQCKSWIDGGLLPRAVSRDLEWGVPVPVAGAEGKVLYVWFDAPIGYISNTKELLPKSWETWWKSEDTKLVHFIGKDNIVFHCIVFPSMLKAHSGYILPDNVPANEFLNLENNKISTSGNWAVWLHEYLEDFPGQEDVLRYVLCANAPETKDNDFTWKDFQQRNNSELVAIFGNFVNRAFVLTQKYFDGKVPEYSKAEPADKETLDQILPCKEAIEKFMETYHFREALKEAMNIARIGNKYISDTEPWSIAKTDMERTGSILNISLQICATLATVFEPFLPFTCEKLRKMLNADIFAGSDFRKGEGVPTENFYKEDEGKAIHTGKKDKGIVLNWSQIGQIGVLPAGHELGKSELLFSKIEDSTIENQINKLERARQENIKSSSSPAEKQKDEVTFDDFEKMDIRTATVTGAERVPKTDKLLKLTLDTGIDSRVIVSGIAEYYSPEDMVGKQICILANLAPKKIKGIESRGMILMARDKTGKMKIIAPENLMQNGSEIG